jgi:hypothetical protein
MMMMTDVKLVQYKVEVEAKVEIVECGFAYPH